MEVIPETNQIKCVAFLASLLIALAAQKGLYTG